MIEIQEWPLIYLYELSSNRVIYGRHDRERLIAEGLCRDPTQQEIDSKVLQDEKDKYIKSRNCYLNETYAEWFDDVENIPQDISNNRTTCKNQKTSINACTTIAELNALGFDKNITF